MLKAWEKPFVCAFGDSDPITRGGEGVLKKLIPGAAGQPHTTLEGVAHFSQEDAPEHLAEIIVSVAEGGAGPAGDSTLSSGNPANSGANAL